MSRNDEKDWVCCGFQALTDAAEAAADAYHRPCPPKWRVAHDEGKLRVQFAVRLALLLDPVWLAWNDGAAVRVAEGIRASRQFGDLPILADALEDAGCDEAGLLNLLRSSATQADGWVLDLLLD